MLKWVTIITIGLTMGWVLPTIIPLEEMELKTLYGLCGKLPQNNLVWLVSIDEELDKIGGGIPHNRYGELIKKLIKQYNPVAIGFDVVFAKAKNVKEDFLFAQSVQEAKNVYFGLPPTQKKIPPCGFAYPITGSIKTIPEIDNPGLNLLPQVITNSAGIGHIAKSKKSGYLPLLAKYNGRCYPNLGLQIAFDYLSRKCYIPKERLEIKVVPGRYLVLKEKEGISAGDKGKELSPRVPIDMAGRMLVNFAQHKIVSFGEIMSHSLKVLPEEKGKIVLIGGTKESSGDSVVTPIGLVPGVSLVACVIENIIKQRFLVKPLNQLTLSFLILVLCLSIGFGLPRLRLKSQLLFPMVILAGYSIVVLYLFKHGIWLDLFKPTLTILTCCLGVIVIERIKTEQDKKELEISLQKTSNRLKDLSEEKDTLLEEREHLLRKKAELLKLSEISRQERDNLIEEIERLKLQLVEKEKQIKQTEAEIKEIEEQVKIEIDFKRRQIRSPLKNKTLTIKPTQPFVLLEYLIREGKMHWSEGYIIFREWRKPKKTHYGSKNSAFIQVVNELNGLLADILEKGIVENIRGGQYELSLRDNEYKSNIKEAKILIEEAKSLLLDDEIEQAKEYLLKAISLDENNLESYKLLKKELALLRNGSSPAVVKHHKDKEIDKIITRYEEMLMYEINRCKKAMELIQQDPSIKEEEREYVRIKLEKLEKNGGGLINGDKPFIETIELIKGLQTNELKGNGIYKNLEFERLLNIDFIKAMLQEIPDRVAKRMFDHWGIIISSEEIMGRILLCFYEIIKNQLVIEEAKTRDSLVKYLQEALFYKLSDEIIAENYGIDINDLPRIRKLKKAKYEIEEELGNKGQSREATDEEIIKKMGCTKQEYERLKAEYSKIQTTILDADR